MKKLLVSLALASSALIAAAPASAQAYGDRYQQDRDDNRYGRDDNRYDRDGDRYGREYRGEDLRPRLGRINAQISRGLERGVITPREGQQLRWEMNNIWTQARQFYRTGGYDYREQAILDRRIDRLQERVRDERRDDDRRWRRY